MPKSDTKTLIDHKFKARIKSFKLTPIILKKFQKSLAPEEKFILKVILLRERDKLTTRAEEEGRLLTTGLYEQFDEIVVDAFISTNTWDKIVASYVRHKIQSQRARSDGAGAASHSDDSSQTRFPSLFQLSGATNNVTEATQSDATTDVSSDSHALD